MVDLSFINPFVTGAVQAFMVQGRLSVAQIERPFMKGKAPMPSIAIASQLKLETEAFKGSLGLSFEEQVYTKIMSGMLGADIKAITPENQDGCAEFLNLAYGFGKMKLNEQGHKLGRALPVLQRGKDLQNFLGNFPTLVVPIRTEHGYAYVEIAVESAVRKN